MVLQGSVPLCNRIVHTDCVGKDCLITEEKKGDPKRLHKSGAYKTYRDICYDDETGRQSFMMSKDLDKNDKPWTYCMQMSMDNECSGKTVAMNVQTLGMIILPPLSSLAESSPYPQINATISPLWSVSKHLP